MDYSDLQIDKVTKYKKDKIIWWVYEGVSDQYPTKWVTQGRWDKRITISMGEDGDLVYRDGHGIRMYIFESGEAGYDDW